MAEPKIDPDWHNDHNMALRPFLVIGIPVFIIVVAVVLSFFKGCTALGQQGSQDSFNPAECSDEGFVGGTNRLLAELLKDTDTVRVVYDLESLNRKYRALEFALPYGEGSTQITEASDLRLVGIHAERIKSKEDRMFYYNSRLPQVLQRQKLEMAETFFRIKSRGGEYDRKSGVRPISITSVEIIPSLFKVALSKDPWTGIIECADNSLFNDSNTVYVSYGNSVLPLRKVKNHAAMNNSIAYDAVANVGRFYYRKDGSEVDYYRHFKEMFDHGATKESLQIFLRETKDADSELNFNLSYLGDSLEIATDTKIRAYSSKGVKDINKDIKASQFNQSVAIEDGLKLVVYNGNGQKRGEFTVYTGNPIRKLSCLVQTNEGKQRYNISPVQTDLFTQQVIRGLSRNLSNSYNIDTVRVTLDPMLSLEFEGELKSYLQHNVIPKIESPSCQKKQAYDISLTVMDLETGDIIASPFYTTKFDSPDYPSALKMTTRNPALVRRYLGSTFKPMLALAAVQTYNGLIGLSTVGRCIINGDQAIFFGRKTGAWAKGTSYWGGTDFRGFISRSDDVYPVALAAFAMTGQRSPGFNTLPTDADGNFFTCKNGILKLKKTSDTNVTKQNHPFTNWISYLYDANYSEDYSTDIALYQNLYRIRDAKLDDERFGLEGISPDVTNLNLNRFFEGGEFHQILVPWVLGQGDNQWNCFKVAEAWCRMIGKRKVSMSLLKTEQCPVSLADIQKGSKLSCIDNKNNFGTRSVNDIWNRFLTEFNAAQSGAGTLLNMNNAVNGLNSGIDKNLLLFSKTGTPDSYVRYETPLLGGNNRQIDIGMYSFALVDRSQYGLIRSNKPGKGVVCVLRITRTYECKACTEVQRKGGKRCSVCEAANTGERKNYTSLWSWHARDFFSAHPDRLRKFYDMTRRYY